MTILYFLYFFIGFLFFYKTLKNPQNYMSISLISIIIGCGPMVEGYPLLDEYIVVMLLTGVFIRANLAPGTGVIKFINTSNIDLHNFLFYLLVSYFLICSVRGMFVLDDLRMLRWVIFFLILGIFSYIFSNYRFLIDRKQIIKIIFYSTNLYFIMYFLIGFIFDRYVGISKFDIQGFAWVGTSAAALPLILYSISLMFFSDEFKNKKTIITITFSLTFLFICSIYYDSRISIIILSITSFYFLLNFIKKRLIVFFILFPLILISFSYILSSNDQLRQDIVKYLPYDFDRNNFAIPSIVDPETDDLDRVLEPKAAILAVKYETDKLFFGYGWYVARIVMKEVSNSLRSKEGLRIIHDDIYQPAGISAMIVDTGIIGCLLFLINFFLSISKIYKYSSKHKFFTSLILLFVIILFFVGNITPLLLTFILIMPNSPIFIMVNDKKNSRLLKN